MALAKDKAGTYFRPASGGGDGIGDEFEHPVVATDILYRGALVMHNAAGYLAPGADTASCFFAGMMTRQADNSAGAAGAIDGLVVPKGLRLCTIASGGLTQANVGDQVALVGFGTFSVRERAARSGRNPQTGATIQIAAAKVPSFKAGKALKDACN